MKKILICLTIICLFLLTGCGNKFELDLKKIDENITSLKSDEFARVDAASILSENISDLEDVYNIKKTFDIDLDDSDYEVANVATNKKKTAMYFIVKPLEGKKEEVKNAIDKYVNSLKKEVKSKLTYEEYQDHLIYIIADNSKELLTKVKDCKSNVFNNLIDVDDLKQTFDIDDKLVSTYLAKVPMMVINSNSVIILKPEKGKTKEVKEKMNTYMEKLEEQWKTYLPDQYELVKNRLEEEYGDYLIYIISKDNDKVFNIIKEAKLAK